MKLYFIGLNIEIDVKRGQAKPRWLNTLDGNGSIQIQRMIDIITISEQLHLSVAQPIIVKFLIREGINAPEIFLKLAAQFNDQCQCQVLVHLHDIMRSQTNGHEWKIRKRSPYYNEYHK